MDFLKKSRTYLVQHTKKQAVEELKKDSRIKNIISKPFFMIIETNPIKTDDYFYPDLSLEPIGSFIITIRRSIKLKRLMIKMVRIEGGVTSYNPAYHESGKRQHIHIDYGNEYDKVCFGSAQSEMNKIQDNKDWYWAGKMSLNLLQDNTDHNYKTIRAIELMVLSQIQYMKNEKFEKNIKAKTIEMIKKDKRLMEEYNIWKDDYFVKIEGVNNG